jgi:GntR family carbon starvation induced transcriptional regulator
MSKVLASKVLADSGHPARAHSQDFQLPDKAPKTLAEAVYIRLREDILSGKLKPGSKLRFADLVASYEAGMSTLRESLSRLTADRLVVAEGQRGFRVSPISLNEMWDITRLRAEIESAALGEAIDAGDDAWEAEILSCLHRLIKLEDRHRKTPLLLTEEGAHLHKLFHMSLLSACPSIWRLRVIDVLYDHSERYRRLQTSYLSNMLNSSQEHREIADAVVARQKSRATALLILHLEKTAEMLARIEDLWSGA